MKEFGSLIEFSTFLAEAAIKQHEVLHAGLEKVAQSIEQTAKDEIGHYQPEVGPFPEWEELADSTEADKARKGYPLDAPLLRDGTLRDSIGHEVDGLEAVIGSTSDIAVYQEMGTNTIPPRPFLGPAAFRSKKVIEMVLGAASASGLIGENNIRQALGYDFDVKPNT